MYEERNNELPEYLHEWKRDHDKRWRERWSQYYERLERLKESLSTVMRSKQDPGAIVVATPEWVFYEKIAGQPHVNLEEWK